MPTDDRKRGHQDRGNPSTHDDDRGTSARKKARAPDQRGGDVPPQTDNRETHVGGGRARVDANEGSASGSVDRPIPPGEYQAGDLGEQAQQLGGPVDVFPTPDQSRKDGPAG